MKNLELIEKSLKKGSTQQLIAKLGKLNANSDEYQIILSIIEKRGQDISKWKSNVTVSEVKVEEVAEQPKPIAEEKVTDILSPINEPIVSELTLREKLIKKVDEFMDELIATKRHGVNSEVLKALGGKYGDDLDDLFETATEEQLRDALSFKKNESKVEPIVVKVTKKKEIKSIKEKKESSSTKMKINNSKTENLQRVEFQVARNSKKASDETLQGDVVSDFICPKTSKRFFRIKTDKGLFLKKADSCKLI